jgi:uncharacterized membrane protein
MNLKEIQKILYLLTSGTAIWLLLIVLAPMFKSSDIYTLKSISNYVYFFYEPVCHQIPERAIRLNNEPLAVCTRCSAIYIGAFVFLLFSIFTKKMQNVNPGWMVLIFFPTVVDFVMEKIGFYVNIPTVRFITGLLFGVASTYLILYSLIDLKCKNINKQDIYYGKSEIN